MPNKSLFILLFITLLSLRASANTNDNILIINAYGKDYQWSNLIIGDIYSTLNKNNKNPNINVEFISSEKISNPSLWVERVNLALSLYKDTPPKAIVLISDEAWMAYNESDNKRFKDVPLILCAVKPHSLSIENYKDDDKNSKLEHYESTYDLMRSYNAFGIIKDMNPSKNIALMLNTIPDIDRMIFITDNRFYGIYNKILFQKHMREALPEYHAEYFDARKMSSDELLDNLKNTTPTTGILMTSWLNGEEGFQYTRFGIYKDMFTASKAPIFITNDIGLNTNLFLGGYFLDGDFWGEKTGLILNDILENKTPTNRVTTYKDDICQINHNILNLFDLSKKDFPKNTRYINTPNSILKVYKNEFLFLSLLFVMLLLTIVITIRSNINAKKSQKRLNAAMDEANRTNDALIDTREKLKIALLNAQKSDRLKSAFISNMEHEIKTPLSAIVGFSNIISNMETTEEREEISLHIKQNSENLLDIIKNIIDLSQLESDEIKFSRETTQAYALCRDLIDSYAPFCNNSTKLSLNPPEIPVTITTDPIRLSQMISIMLNNAIKFTKEGEIELGYFSNDDSVEFYVKDTGVGVPEDKTDEIFGPFIKLDTYKSGSGLGLTILRHLAAKLGGEVGISSREGEGSRFWFRIKNNY